MRHRLPFLTVLLGGALAVFVAGPGGPGPSAGPERFGAPENPPAAPADTLRIVEGETFITAVVQTRGVAARFAPDHLFHAPANRFTLVLDAERPEEASFHGEVWISELGVDEFHLQREVQDRLLELGLLDDPYEEMSEEDRDRVRGAMIDEDQLHAQEHPTIEVETRDLRETGNDLFPWEGTLVMTMRGIQAEAPFHARLQEEGDRHRVEGHAGFRFTDFGIEPYRAFLGAVQNRDEFSLYLSLLAERPSGGSTGR